MKDDTKGCKAVLTTQPILSNTAVLTTQPILSVVGAVV